jgi:hypothetical protein
MTILYFWVFSMDKNIVNGRVILWSKFIAQEKAGFRRSEAEARRREAWGVEPLRGPVYIPFRVCSSMCYSSCKPPLGVVNTHSISWRFAGWRSWFFPSTLEGFFHVKSSCLLWLLLLFFFVYSPSLITGRSDVYGTVQQHVSALVLSSSANQGSQASSLDS